MAEQNEIVLVQMMPRPADRRRTNKVLGSDIDSRDGDGHEQIDHGIFGDVNLSSSQHESRLLIILYFYTDIASWAARSETEATKNHINLQRLF